MKKTNKKKSGLTSNPPLSVSLRIIANQPTEKDVEQGTILCGTHGGHFHSDEALAIFLLLQLPEYQNMALVRTRDKEILKKCDILVDVGSEYNPEKFRFDHHQRGFNETFSAKFETKMSSAGLIYKRTNLNSMDSPAPQKLILLST